MIYVVDDDVEDIFGHKCNIGSSRPAEKSSIGNYLVSTSEVDLKIRTEFEYGKLDR